MPLPYKSELIPVAQELRKNATRQEKHLWYDFLNKYPVRFQRQKAISGFIVDFYCFKAQLVVEIDGSQHHTESGEAYDKERTAILEGYGLKVIRFSNEEIDKHFDFVCKKIDAEVKKRLPQSASLTAPPKEEPKPPKKGGV
ncbi:MAG: endonuclease domain-containing protein [Acutalibacteraceae bacterium]